MNRDSQNDSPTIQSEDQIPMVEMTSTEQHSRSDPTTDDTHDLHEADDPSEVPLTERLEDDEIALKAYKRRFWILLIFALVAFTQYCAWNTYGPIAPSAKAVFGWSNTEIAVLASMDPIIFLFTMTFVSWVMDVKGLRMSMLVSTGFMFVGIGLRCVTSDSKYAFWSMGLGQLLNGLAGPVAQAAPTLLSASWFPSHQRTTATAVTSLCGSLGVAMSFLIGPAFVRDLKTELELLHPTPVNHTANISHANVNTSVSLKAKENLIEEVRDEIMMLLYIECGVAAALVLAVLIYFPDKPPSPPSKTAEIQREDFRAGFKQLIRNRQFWILAIAYGVTTGVYSGWGAGIAVNLETFNVTQSEASWIGFYSTIAGIGAGLILGRCSDLFGGRMKALLVFLFFGSSGCFLWFALLCLKMIPFDNVSLYMSSVLGGFFVSGTIPLFMELSVETTYPVAEGVTTGLLTLINNSFTVLFLIVLAIPGVGTVWMNWCMLGACAGCIPVMLSFREEYRRRNVDDNIKTDRQIECK